MGLLDFKRGRTSDDVGAQAESRNGNRSIVDSKADLALQVGRIVLDAIEEAVEVSLKRREEEARVADKEPKNQKE